MNTFRFYDYEVRSFAFRTIFQEICLPAQLYNTKETMSNNTDNELAQNINELYGYEERVLGPPLFCSDAILTVPSSTSPSAKDYPPMPKERLERKQRSLTRRGGADHSALLKSAVLASLDFHDSESEEDAYRTPRRESAANNSEDSINVEGPPSPRKRARFAGEKEEESEELSIARASELLGTMCVGPTLSDSENPARRVSRRISYDGDVAPRIS